LLVERGKFWLSHAFNFVSNYAMQEPPFVIDHL
jgi:hypothetical protein